MINVAVLGYGTVGSGVVEVIEKNKDMVNKKSAQELKVKYILDLRDFPGDPYEDKVIHDFNTILHDDSVTIVCETMGGVGAAYQFTKQALERGKSVCTSNKELVAKHGPDCCRSPREHNCNYLFEASVGGGSSHYPSVELFPDSREDRGYQRYLKRYYEYILSKMEKEGADFAAVLKEAQDKGYAERNPEADVEGYDACRKIAILSSLAYGKFLNYEEIYTEGITKVTPEDMEYAAELGMTVKLLATSRKVGNDSFYAMVAPFLLGKNSPLYSVNGVFNSVFVHGNVLGDAMFYGSGAGKLPTASAVVADVVDEAKHLHRNIMTNWTSRPLHLMELDQVAGRFFVRVKGATVEQVEEVFGKVEIVNLKKLPGEFAFVTSVMKQAEYKEKAARLNGKVVSMIQCKD